MIGTEKIWYWRRQLALGLDYIAFALIFTVLATLIFGAQSNVVRLSGFGITTSYCEAGNIDPKVLAVGNAMMPGVVWNQAAICQVSSFGLARNRIAHLARVEQGADKVKRAMTVTVPIDEAGRAVNPFYLDWIGLLAFAVAILAFQASRWQATPAMRLLRLRLVGENGGPAGAKGIILRVLYALLIMVALITVIAVPVLLVIFQGWSMWVVAPCAVAVLIGYLLWWRPFEYKSSLPRAPLHDILAKTRIVRVVAASH